MGRLAAVGGTFLILSSLLLSVGVSAAIAADTGAKAPGATTAPNEWSGGGNALADGGGVATSSADNDDQGYRDFGLNIPNGSIIDGITVRAEAASTDSSGCQLQFRASWNSGSSWTDYETMSLTGSASTLSAGGASDDWNHVWDPTQMTDDVFRLEMRNNDPGSSCSGGSTTSVDWIDLTVTYRTVKGGTANPALSKGVCNKADFNFIIDMSGSIGPQDGNPSNLPQLQAGITGFIDAFAAAGGDGIYSGTRFNGSSANTMTSGYDSAAAFRADVVGLTNPNGTTPTAAGINTGAGNDSGDRGDAPNVMFVVTDGSPNVPGGDLGDPPTWLQAANAAVDAADAARGDGYVVKAVYLSTAGDPGDTTLPFSSAGDAAWAKKVMQEIGGGAYLDADFKNFVKDLFEAIHCAPPPTVTLTKSVDDDSKPEPGGTFNFKLTIKNTSDHSVKITELTDDNPLSDECKGLVGDSLGAGDSVSCEYSVDHTAIGTYPNEATVTVTDSDGGSDSDKDQQSVEVTDILPEVTLEKTVTPSSRAEPGGAFDFTLKITNTSKETVVITALTDDNALSSECLGLVGDSLAPGGSTSCTYQVVHTNAGTFDNTAEVTVADDEQNTDSDKDSASVEVTDVAPTISVDKTADPTTLPEPGGTFTFKVKVTNGSVEKVTITSLTDDIYGNLNGKGTCAIGAELDPGASYSCSFPGTFTGNADATQTDWVTAKAVDNDKSEASAKDDATVRLTDVRPTIVVDKTATPLTRAEPGGSFTFDVKVTNTSAESVTITALSDDIYGNLQGKGTCATGAVLPAGGSYSCSFTGTFTGNAGASQTDIVSAAAVDNDGSTATDTDDAIVSLTDVKPTIDVDKTADPSVVDEPGGDVTFTVKVKNTSFEPVTLDSLVDDVHGDLNGQGSCATGGSIASGATYTCSFTANVSGNAGDFETDTVTASASDDDKNSVKASDEATVTIANIDPSIRVVKDASPATRSEPGGSFKFDVTVINDSNEAVTLIGLTDDIYGNLVGQGDCAIGAVIPADGGTYVCSFGGSFMGDAGDSQTDVVTATVVDDDKTEKSNFDDATVRLTDVPPTISVDKTASPDKVEAGTEVTFTVKVTNTSDETVWLESLTDSIHGDLDDQGTCVADGSIAIEPKATYTCSFTAVVDETETDVVTATVGDNEENEVSDDDDATVTVADLTIDKSVENVTADRGTTDDGAVISFPGDTLHYTLAFKMTNGPLHGVVITDALPEGLGVPSNISDGGLWDADARTITWDLGTLEADGVVSYDVIVASGADKLEQPLENIATIDSDETSPDDDDADTKVVPSGAVKPETSKPTLPPTDTIGGDSDGGTPGSGLVLILFALAGLALGASFLTPAPAKARNRRPRR
jgi:uncharacterized repeat protein (TIGR01451 family)